MKLIQNITQSKNSNSKLTLKQEATGLKVSANLSRVKLDILEVVKGGKEEKQVKKGTKEN